MSETKVSSMWVRRVVETHRGPAEEVEAHLRALGLSEGRVAKALAAWRVRHPSAVPEPRTPRGT